MLIIAPPSQGGVWWQKQLLLLIYKKNILLNIWQIQVFILYLYKQKRNTMSTFEKRMAAIKKKEEKKTWKTCTCCERSLKPGTEIELELSQTDDKYYQNVPADHESQGFFYFGSACAEKVLKNDGEI